MASFDKFAPTLLENEGGYVNDPDDKGGETYRGIARNYHPEWSGWAFIDSHKPISYNKVFPELEDKVKAFFKAEYWNPLSADQIKTQEIAEVLVDWKVNGGLSISTLQQILVDLGQSISVDGKFGSQTLSAINKVNQNKLFNELIVARKEHYDNIVSNDPSQEKFYEGWMKRLADFSMPKMSKKNVLIVMGISTVLVIVYAWYAGWLKRWLGTPKTAFA